MPWRVPRWKSNLIALSGSAGGPPPPEDELRVGITFGPVGGIERIEYVPSTVTVASGAPIAPIVPRLAHDRPAEFPLTVEAPGLPSGLSVDAATGTISGTPAAPGTTSVRVVAQTAGRSVWTILTLVVT